MNETANSSDGLSSHKINSNSSSVSSTPQPGCFTSRSIPLPSTYVPRTESEAQLALDVAAAERRDERMFRRLIYGIHDRHQRLATKTGISNLTRSTPSSESPEYGVFNVSNCLDPVTTIAKIVDAHRTKLNDSTDRILNSTCYQYDVDDQSSSPQLTVFESHKQTSDSTLSDSDWSITGFEPGIADEIDLKDARKHSRIEHEEDEDIFILDI
jgi:hypothetical protein